MIDEPIRENIEIPIANNIRLRGEVSLPVSGGRTPWIVFAHGLASTRGGEKARVVKAECERRGWAFGAIDFRGHGESDGTMVDLRGSQLLEDLDEATAFFLERSGGPLFLFGSSMGGWAALWFAALNRDRVAACAVVAPAFGFLKRPDLSPEEREQWRRTGRLRIKDDFYDYELGYGLVEESSDYEVETLLTRYQKPLLIFHGMKDEVVPYSGSLQFAARCVAADVEVRLFKSGDHRLNTEKEMIARAACDYFESYG
jgi:pimeloyl-ACP methyl ester carboxylesterase